MTSRDFCYWLQGYFELRASDGVDVEPTPEMLEMIRKHLALVFAHEIDPSAGPPAGMALQADARGRVCCAVSALAASAGATTVGEGLRLT